MKINNGDWVVVKDRWRIEARPVIKVTAKLVFWQSKHSAHTFRVRLEEVVFAGDQKTASLLAQRLMSSMAQQSDEERSAMDRRLARDQKLIEESCANQ